MCVWGKRSRRSKGVHSIRTELEPTSPVLNGSNLFCLQKKSVDNEDRLKPGGRWCASHPFNVIRVRLSRQIQWQVATRYETWRVFSLSTQELFSKTVTKILELHHFLNPDNSMTEGLSKHTPVLVSHFESLHFIYLSILFLLSSTSGKQAFHPGNSGSVWKSTLDLIPDYHRTSCKKKNKKNSHTYSQLGEE